MTETLGELCAGYGGLGMAVEKVFKARLAWYSEYDAAPSRILSFRWPGVSNLGDRGEGWAEPTGQLRRLDAPIGGSPLAANAISGGRDGRPREARREAEQRAPVERPGEGISWGKYELGIRRQELIFGRRVTRPTEPTGRNGGERLSPRFTEWMMGLPEGWVTDPAIGISRNEQLKACGNGVVPQQAEAALRDMLATFQAERIAA